MAIQNSGPISLSDIATEFGGTAPHSINEYYGAASGVPTSGRIGFDSFYGTSSVFVATVTTNQTNLNIREFAINSGWDRATALQVIINPGVVISGNTQGNSTAALYVDNWFNGASVTLINKGIIRGRGGKGGNGGYSSSAGSAGATGGRALLVSHPITIDNQGSIEAGAGGGGGGGGASHSVRNWNKSTTTYRCGGGGGGGGRSSGTNASGGAGGTTASGNFRYNGKAGGTGTLAAQGGGGAGGANSASRKAGNGGRGGLLGSNGANGGGSTSSKAGGGGGLSGQAVSGNANITWTATGSLIGRIA